MSASSPGGALTIHPDGGQGVATLERLEIGFNSSRVLFGIFIGTMAVVGFAFAPLNWLRRAIYAIIALAIALPSEVFAGAIYLNAVAFCSRSQRRVRLFLEAEDLGTDVQSSSLP
jgi:hypothetical protein